MKIPGAQLRELHRLLRQMHDLRTQLDRGPRQIAAKQQMVANASTAVDTAKTNLRDLRMSSDRKQLQLRDRTNKLNDLNVKMNQAASNREYQTLKEQIAADKQANNVLSDEILETMEQIDAAQVTVKECEERLKQIQTEEEAFRKQVNARMEQVKSELQRVSDEYKAEQSRLPAEFMTDYLRVVQSRNEEALAEMDNMTCGGCYQVLSPKIVDHLRLDNPVFCTSCGRLLYLASKN